MGKKTCRAGGESAEQGLVGIIHNSRRNPICAKALENIWDLCDWVGDEILHMKDRREEVIREHSAVVEMLKKNDAEGAATD